MKIAIISPKFPPTHCGIGDYTKCLAENLSANQHQVIVITKSGQNIDPDASYRVDDSWSDLGVKQLIPLVWKIKSLAPNLLIWNWEAFIYGRRGIFIAVPLMAILLRLLSIKQYMVVHELWIDWSSGRRLILAVWQRIMFTLMISAVDFVGVSIEYWTAYLKKIYFWKKNRIRWLGISSAIPKAAKKEKLNQELSTKISISGLQNYVAVFSLSGSGKSIDLIQSAWQELEKDDDLNLVIMGKIPLELPIATSQRAIYTGFLESHEIALLLRHAQFLLVPFTDGISARRSSAIAALNNGCPILTTNGRLFDKKLFGESPLYITDYDPKAYARKAVEIHEFLKEPQNRLQMEKECEAFYNEQLSFKQHLARLFDQIADPN